MCPIPCNGIVDVTQWIRPAVMMSLHYSSNADQVQNLLFAYAVFTSWTGNGSCNRLEVCSVL